MLWILFMLVFAPLDVGDGLEAIGVAQDGPAIAAAVADADGDPLTSGVAGAGGTVLQHNGRNTMWYAVMWIAPEKKLAFVATTNSATPGAQQATDQAIVVLLTAQGLLE